MSWAALPEETADQDDGEGVMSGDQKIQLYRYYKGSLYEFITDARCQKSGVEFVVYRSVWDGLILVSHKSEFYEKVTVVIDGKTKLVPRFEKVSG